jgi:MFS transporter, FHS family, L-fucose permease
MNKLRVAVVPRHLVVPFILITSCFALWGFANDITNPMVKAFSRILMMSNFEGSLVQFAFYGGYFAMAFPAALFIKRFSYKAGILVGLGLYAVGAMMFIPASISMIFWPFLLAYFVLTCGLSFLETSANPYILSMGPEQTATQRLNLAQSFNPMGSLLGMFTAQQFILAKLNPASAAERSAMDPATLHSVTASDLTIIRNPYVFISLVILVVLVVIAITKLPRNEDGDHNIHFMVTVRRLLKHKRYYEGVIAQMFYVGVQIMVWTFIIHYAVNELGLSETAAQGYNIVAMVTFVTSRFICTFLLKYISPGKLLMYLAIGGMLTTLGAIFLTGMAGLYSLVAISACMSLMFPTIYGIALHGMGGDAKIGAAGLIMAILGGSIMPPLMGSIIDMGEVMDFSATRASFFLPVICFVVIIIYGYRSYTIHRQDDTYWVNKAASKIQP